MFTFEELIRITTCIRGFMDTLNKDNPYLNSLNQLEDKVIELAIYNYPKEIKRYTLIEMSEIILNEFPNESSDE